MVGEGPCGSEEMDMLEWMWSQDGLGASHVQSDALGEWPQHLSQKLRNSHAQRVKLMAPSLLRTLPGQPSPCSFASRALFQEYFEFKVLRIWEEVMEYISFWGKVMCKSSNNSLK